MSAPHLSLEKAVLTVEAVNECMEEGFALEASAANPKSAKVEAANRLGMAAQTLRHRLSVAKQQYGLEPDPSRYRPARKLFTVEDVPDDPDLDAEGLIETLVSKYERRKLREEASELRQVQVHIDGPIGIAMFGDPHLDDGGCAWPDLKADVETVRDTQGFLATDVGDNSNNWVGRLLYLYADQEVTPKQALALIQWLMTQIPWLLWELGNHDAWNTIKGDPVEVMHRIMKMHGVLGDGGTRMELHLPAGCSFRMHIRHDFPGNSQFNPAHALVRQTLFDHRDHILGCGHRHTSGYMPIWHNDPPRLCHGFRVGTYKDFDKFAKDKGFKKANWARSMAATIDPDHANDPVRYIKEWFSLQEAAEYLTWRRAKWELGKTHA